ncbi:sensor histidine kinase [Denitrobaculum tricleocarpae]|uniref:histidine kinase n=1 Tax=Denitrobaculum tricleocarpae TaxID=2591009 RepID=A0A545T821_9PROT|nr:ATP-binding protein [Denitrobaculum tricleocarpae]TQV73352.1 hypothetical protein FKG95_25390 [Denitrobaculum tricleocarpae]
MDSVRNGRRAYIAVAVCLISLLVFVGFFIHSSEREQQRLAEAELTAVANGIATLAVFELKTSPAPNLPRLLQQLAVADDLLRIAFQDNETAKTYEVVRSSNDLFPDLDDPRRGMRLDVISLEIPVFLEGKLQGRLELEKPVLPPPGARSMWEHLFVSLLTLFAALTAVLIGLRIFVVARSSASSDSRRPLSPLEAIVSPFRSHDSADFAALRPDQVAAVVRQAGFTMMVNLANISFLLAILWQEVPLPLLIPWAVFVYLLVLAALWSWWRNHKRPLPDKVSKRALRRMTYRAGVLGLAWGIALSVFFTDASAVARYILIAVGLGTAAGGTAALAPVPSAAIAFTSAILVPAALRFATLEGDGFITLAVLCVLFACAMGAFLSQVYHAFARNVLARLDEARHAETLALVMNTYEEQASDWLWETDSDGRLRAVPRRMELLFGKNTGGLTGRTFREIGAGSEGNAWYELLQKLDAGQGFRGEVIETLDHLGERRWISLSGRCRPGGEWHGVGSDVTERERALASMREAIEAAEAASRVTSAFLATTSHELRTPLNAIIGFSQMLTIGQLKPEKVKDYIQTINSAGQHLLQIVNGILEMAQIEAGSKRLFRETFDLEEIVGASVEFLSFEASKAKVTVRVAPSAAPIRICADRQALRQVLLNIIGNAVKFTPEGGSIDVAARTLDDSVEITVADTGIGISQRHIDRVFQPFAQADDRLARRYEGTGLGLSIAKGLIELHGGSLLIRSRVGEGTTLTVTLPRGLSGNQLERQEPASQ